MSGDALLPLIANALCGLTHLDIRGCRRACPPHAFAALSRLTSLRRLVAKGCLLQQDAVHTLALLTGLQQLDVAENRRLLALGSWTALRYASHDWRCSQADSCSINTDQPRSRRRALHAGSCSCWM